MVCVRKREVGATWRKYAQVSFRLLVLSISRRFLYACRKMLRAEKMGRNSLRSDKRPISSNVFSCEPRGSQACKSGTRFRRLTCAGD